MLVDSHCHLDFPELANDLDGILQRMRQNDVGYALCVGVNLENFPRLLTIAEQYSNIFASVGVHPDYDTAGSVAIGDLLELARHPKVVAIGETGLDYFRLKGDLDWQRERFRCHIRAARRCGKPLIIHTREAAADTLRIMEEESAADIGGVMHCFTESWDVARAALGMGFYISFSGIVTFKNAAALKEVAVQVPLDRLLVETDSPYLAPAPYRGKRNEPAYVKHVAQAIADLRGIVFDELAEAASRNFFNLFKTALKT